MKVAIYARVSTDDGRQDTENQLAELRRFAESEGWEISGEYIDHESGGTPCREQLTRMFADAARRQFGILLVWALDRLTREGIAKTFRYLDLLESHKVKFVSLTEQHFRTIGEEGDLLMAVAAWIARQERRRITERVQAGVKRAQTNGTRSGRAIGRPRVIVDRDRAIKLRQQGLSWREIGSKLHAGTTTVRRICTSNVARQNPTENLR